MASCDLRSTAPGHMVPNGMLGDLAGLPLLYMLALLSNRTRLTPRLTLREIAAAQGRGYTTAGRAPRKPSSLVSCLETHADAKQAHTEGPPLPRPTGAVDGGGGCMSTAVPAVPLGGTLSLVLGLCCYSSTDPPSSSVQQYLRYLSVSLVTSMEIPLFAGDPRAPDLAASAMVCPAKCRARHCPS